jgi:hypothetical protein
MDQQQHRTSALDRPVLWLAGFALAVVAIAFLFVTVENRTQVATNYTPIVDEVRIVPPLTQPAPPTAPIPTLPAQSQ